MSLIDIIKGMGNTVGSLEVPIILRARKRLVLKLSQRRQEILIGCILGDAYISPLGKIRVEQSVKQKEYIQWKYNELSFISYSAQPREIIHVLHGDKEYHSIFFLSRQYFRTWRAIFYDGKSKIFPQNLPLTPLTLAVWYMDDGCWTGKKCLISTESFKGKYRGFMQEALMNQHGIETVVGKNEKLVIRKKSHAKFFSLIAPHIIPSMKYKLP